MTSMNGVMLISLMTPRAPRRRRRRPPSARAPFRGERHRVAASGARDALISSIWRDRIAENSSAKPSSRDWSFVDLRLELVVGEHRRDRREEADRGREQRLGDAGRDDREARVLRGGDRGEELMIPHTVPKRPIKGPAEPIERGPGAGPRAARPRAGWSRRAPCRCAAPGSRRAAGPSKHASTRASRRRRRGKPGVRPAREGPVESRATGPTRRPPRSGPWRAGAAEEQRLVDDDRPAPHRGGKQPDDDELDDDMGVRNSPTGDTLCAVCTAGTASAGFMLWSSIPAGRRTPARPAPLSALTRRLRPARPEICSKLRASQALSGASMVQRVKHQGEVDAGTRYRPPVGASAGHSGTRWMKAVPSRRRVHHL